MAAHPWWWWPKASCRTTWKRPTPNAAWTPSAVPGWAASRTSWPPRLEARTGIETRATILGHIQRGGVPSAFDRVLATRLGMAAIDSVVEGYWGTMVALKGTDIEHVGFDEALGKLKTVPQNRYDEAAVLFG